MGERRYVQHKSGTGEKWRVYNDNDDVYMCEMARATQGVYLPKSEYVLVAPPERWVDVTADCTAERNGGGNLELWHHHNGHGPTAEVVNIGYRLTKVKLGEDYGSGGKPIYAFVVEKQESL